MFPNFIIYCYASEFIIFRHRKLMVSTTASSIRSKFSATLSIQVFRNLQTNNYFHKSLLWLHLIFPPIYDYFNFILFLTNSHKNEVCYHNFPRVPRGTFVPNVSQIFHHSWIQSIFDKVSSTKPNKFCVSQPLINTQEFSSKYYPIKTKHIPRLLTFDCALRMFLEINFTFIRVS